MASTAVRQQVAGRAGSGRYASRMRRLGLALLVALAPATASAANALRPRTPAIFQDTPCSITVDKAVDGPVLHFEYAVPFDDTDVGPDEVPDSRTMQFFAFAKQKWDYKHPVWINQNDYDRADANGDLAGMIAYTDDDILEKSSLWPPDTWVRITPDDARVPITMEQAAMGFDWDITDVHVGTWLVAVYTWEPEQNLWSFRPGAVRILDSNDPDTRPGPSAFLQDGETQIAEVGVEYTVNGCVEAEPGSVYAVSWGKVSALGEPEWITLATDIPVVDGEVRIPFVPPEMADGTFVKLRVDVEEPSGGTFTAYTPRVIEVTCPSCVDDSGGETGTDTSDPTDPTQGTNDSNDSNDTNDTNAAQFGDEGGDMGFGCRTGAPAPIGAVALLFLLGLSRRGRRRC